MKKALVNKSYISGLDSIHFEKLILITIKCMKSCLEKNKSKIMEDAYLI